MDLLKNLLLILGFILAYGALILIGFAAIISAALFALMIWPIIWLFDKVLK